MIAPLPRPSSRRARFQPLPAFPVLSALTFSLQPNKKPDSTQSFGIGFLLDKSRKLADFRGVLYYLLLTRIVYFRIFAIWSLLQNSNNSFIVFLLYRFKIVPAMVTYMIPNGWVTRITPDIFTPALRTFERDKFDTIIIAAVSWPPGTSFFNIIIS